jgi:hypothetical protein
MRKVRGHRTEADLHTLIHSVVASLILWAPYMIGNAIVDGRWAVNPVFQIPCSAALYLCLSYALGCTWGYLPYLVECTQWQWLKDRFGTVESQTVMKFLKDGQGKWMRFRMEDGRQYEGMVTHYDGDPERFKDLHVAFKFPRYSDGTSPFQPLDGVAEILICISDVKAASILPPPTLSTPEISHPGEPTQIDSP